jgi:hypothetical protein
MGLIGRDSTTVTRSGSAVLLSSTATRREIVQPQGSRMLMRQIDRYAADVSTSAAACQTVRRYHQRFPFEIRGFAMFKIIVYLIVRL